MKELIKYIAQALVDNPEQVQVEEVAGRQSSVFELKVAKEDLGKVIGKQGRTAHAIRTILTAASGKTKRRTVLEMENLFLIIFQFAATYNIIVFDRNHFMDFDFLGFFGHFFLFFSFSLFCFNST